MDEITRRHFLEALAAGSAAGAFGARALGKLPSIVSVENPLGAYPTRDWEKVYRDQYHYDRTFTWVCAPNDTHMCRLRAFVRNGVLIRSKQNYDVDRYGDMYGNHATKSWHPRGCLKGYTFQRRVYGPNRLKGPVVRAGWKQWADDGFPSLSDNPALRGRYKFDDRGSDTFVRLNWKQAADYMARGLTAVAKAYSGEEGRRRLLADGEKLTIDPALEGVFEVTGVDGKKIEVMTIFEMYRRHLKDYDVATVSEICDAEPAMIERLAKDLATIKPAAIHFGEGVNHYFHATLHNRACFFLMALTGNLGKHGAGTYAWAGNYKGGLFQAGPTAGPGVGAFVTEDPFHPVLDESATLTKQHLRKCLHHGEPSYWGYGEKILKVKTPQGEKRFTGDTHLPTPTKVIWYNNANFLNQAKWIYELIVHVLPKIDMIVDQQIEWTGSAEYADIVLPVNSWAEFQDLEIAGSCSNPFIQAWGGDGIKPVHDNVDDAMVFTLVGEALAKLHNDPRFADYWKFVREKKSRIYIQRVLDACTTTRGQDGPYSIDRMMKGEYGGEPGAALFLFRTYPRVPFWEQVHDSIPFYTDCGRVAAYCDLDEAIEYGENLIVHREGVEATPYLPNVIVSTSPFIRPNDYGISPEEMDPDLRSVRNIKMPWSQVKKTVNPLWAQGYRYFCSTPKSRHSVHSSWSVVDWNWVWSCDFADPQRRDKRAPGVSDRQIQISPQAAEELGLHHGDYVWVDASPADRPYRGWREDMTDDFRARAFRCMVRVKINPALPPHFTIMKHTGWIASERSVRAHETRPDGGALAEGTGYQASYRYGSHQSITRGWLPPMHQTDSLFHKASGSMSFIFGFDVDNHAVNTVPKETLIRIVKAEDGGPGGKGIWQPATTEFGPTAHTPENLAYLAGTLTRVGAPDEGYGDEY